ncbi:hypothetical protein N8975_02240 [Candidatus Pelagibacter ubique]|nr:hypothetical protein [Candidatus Pelagibacter ubique]
MKTKLKKFNSTHFNKIINEIQKIRKKNNINWMNILKVAYKHAPKETSQIFKKIIQQDKHINLVSKKLIKKKP